MTKYNALRFALIAALATGLAGCRESEQGRPLEHTPGVYTGKKDQKLSDEQREALRQRSRYQGNY
ncbi:MAG: hypothetical protein K0U74_11320 [Alphaproteobacteria bacterium]|nr:hypothetical protein [Alphaproteobacteria bacterium]